MTRRIIIAVTALVTLLTSACASATPTPAPTSAPKASTAPPAPAAVTPAASAAKPAAKPGALDELIEGARKEGVVKARFSAVLSQKGAQRLIDAFNKKYNVGLKLDFTADRQSAASASQLLMEVKTGATPSADVFYGPQTNLYPLAEAKALVPYDWPATLPYITRETMKKWTTCS